MSKLWGNMEMVLSALVIGATGMMAIYLTGGEEEFPAETSVVEMENSSLHTQQQQYQQEEIENRSGGFDDDNFIPWNQNRATMDNLEEVVNSLKQQSEKLENTAEKIVEEQPKWAKELLQLTNKLADDVQFLKNNILNNNEKDSSISPIDAPVKGDGEDAGKIVTSNDQAESDEAIISSQITLKLLEERIQTRKNNVYNSILSLLQSVKDDNSIDFESVRLGCGTLLMYINNLFEHPELPRYRRISTGNQSYKTMLGPLKEHSGVLLSVGFVLRGTTFEWSVPSAIGNDASNSSSTKGASSPLSHNNTEGKYSEEEKNSSLSLLKIAIDLLTMVKAASNIDDCVSVIQSDKETTLANVPIADVQTQTDNLIKDI